MERRNEKGRRWGGAKGSIDRILKNRIWAARLQSELYADDRQRSSFMCILHTWVMSPTQQCTDGASAQTPILYAVKVLAEDLA